MKRSLTEDRHSLRRHPSPPHFSKPYSTLGSLAIVLTCALSAHLAMASGGPLGVLRFLPQNFFLHGPQGYLGVDLKNVDASRAAALKLKGGQGVEIVAVDHDAPAAKAGLRTNDVIVEMNGHAIENCDQLRHLLHKEPPGHTVVFDVNRDGEGINITVRLADRQLLQQKAWSQHYTVRDAPAEGPLNGAQSFVAVGSPSSPLLGTLMPSSLYVGVDVSPVRSQLAAYFGIATGAGLLVESVDADSPGSRAGLRAGDVILKVNDRSMVSRNDWLKMIRDCRGNPVQLTIVRDKQQQSLTMTAGTPKKKS